MFRHFYATKYRTIEFLYGFFSSVIFVVRTVFPYGLDVFPPILHDEAIGVHFFF